MFCLMQKRQGAAEASIRYIDIKTTRDIWRIKRKKKGEEVREMKSRGQRMRAFITTSGFMCRTYNSSA